VFANFLFCADLPARCPVSKAGRSTALLILREEGVTTVNRVPIKTTIRNVCERANSTARCKGNCSASINVRALPGARLAAWRRGYASAQDISGADAASVVTRVAVFESRSRSLRARAREQAFGSAVSLDRGGRP